jgi:hypothetical protein
MLRRVTAATFVRTHDPANPVGMLYLRIFTYESLARFRPTPIEMTFASMPADRSGEPSPPNVPEPAAFTARFCGALIRLRAAGTAGPHDCPSGHRGAVSRCLLARGCEYFARPNGALRDPLAYVWAAQVAAEIGDAKQEGFAGGTLDCK